jgi:hypothetical protein
MSQTIHKARSSLPPLLPRLGHHPAPDRTIKPVACESCRSSKSKVISGFIRPIRVDRKASANIATRLQCSGENPHCSNCVSRGIKCSYRDVRRGESYYEALKRSNYNLLERLKVYEGIFHLIRTSREEVSEELYWQIRAWNGSSSGLHDIEGADLLLQLRSNNS